MVDVDDDPKPSNPSMPVIDSEGKEDYSAWLVGIDDDLAADMSHDHKKNPWIAK